MAIVKPQHTVVTVGGVSLASGVPAVPPPHVTVVSPPADTIIEMTAAGKASPTQSSSTTTICEADVHQESLSEEVEEAKQNSEVKVRQKFLNKKCIFFFLILGQPF